MLFYDIVKKYRFLVMKKSIFISNLAEIIKIRILQKEYIRDVHNFQNKGFIFKDIMPLLIELTVLNGREKLKNQKIYAVLEY